MNRFFLTGIFVLITLTSYAQTSVGIRGGYTTSTYSYRPVPSSRATSVDGIGSPSFALVFEHFNSKNAGIEVNMQFLRIGYSQIEVDSDPIRTNSTQFDYLKIPILSSFFIGRSGRFQIKAGPHLGYMLQVKDITREYSDATPLEIPTFGGASDNPKKIMYGLTAGAGISKLFGKSTLAGEVRFAYDFTNPESQDRIFDMNSTNLEFTLAYLFRIKESKIEIISTP
ncbi:outer membrane protein with beta-barrel domain [Algoriphagus ratkowskyi]|uniref:Outer membrane protein with beta-barrel domain n=1 Tax=Algoriphagus ratkowskyi TaxID=57028 RepID=A0A2W7RMM2_9BACT|nr:outer membrane beta-barrel protein [Algoriphagus ratkowskyi]PZX59740.1 outer membrane protein with beta-barrel domain [Algoriphagus ratkowskyi]TXD78546.1 PorT family protein [Algoriphagus ratkowskyi]